MLRLRAPTDLYQKMKAQISRDYVDVFYGSVACLASINLCFYAAAVSYGARIL